MNETITIATLLDKKLVTQEQLAKLQPEYINALLDSDLKQLIATDMITPQQFAIVLTLPSREIKEIAANNDIFNLICNDYVSETLARKLHGWDLWPWVSRSEHAIDWIMSGMLKPEHIQVFRQRIIGYSTDASRNFIEQLISKGRLTLDDFCRYKNLSVKLITDCADLFNEGQINEAYFKHLDNHCFMQLLTPENPCFKNLKELIRLRKISPEVMLWSLCSSYANFFVDEVTSLVRQNKICLKAALSEDTTRFFRQLMDPWIYKLLLTGLISQREMSVIGGDIQNMSIQERHIRIKPFTLQYIEPKVPYSHEYAHLLNELPKVQEILFSVFNTRPNCIEYFIFNEKGSSRSKNQEVYRFIQLACASNEALRSVVSNYLTSHSSWFSKLFNSLDSIELYQTARKKFIKSADQFAVYPTSVNVMYINAQLSRYAGPHDNIFQNVCFDNRLVRIFTPETPSAGYAELLNVIDIKRVISILSSLNHAHIVVHLRGKYAAQKLACFSQFKVMNSLFSYTAGKGKVDQLDKTIDLVFQCGTKQQVLTLSIKQFESLLKTKLLQYITEKMLTAAQVGSFLEIDRNYIEAVTNHSQLSTLIARGKFDSGCIQALNKTYKGWDWLFASPRAIEWINKGLLKANHIRLIVMVLQTNRCERFEEILAAGLIKFDHLDYLNCNSIEILMRHESVLREGILTQGYIMPMRNNHSHAANLVSNPVLRLIRSGHMCPEILEWYSGLRDPFLTERVATLVQENKLCLPSLTKLKGNLASYMLNNRMILALLEQGFITNPDLARFHQDFNAHAAPNQFTTPSLNQLPTLERTLAEVFARHPGVIIRFIEDFNCLIQLIDTHNAELRESVGMFLLSNEEWFARIFNDNSSQAVYTVIQQHVKANNSLRSGFHKVFQHDTYLEAKAALVRLIDINHVGLVCSLFKRRLPEDINLLIAKQTFSANSVLTIEEKEATVYSTFAALNERATAACSARFQRMY